MREDQQLEKGIREGKITGCIGEISKKNIYYAMDEIPNKEHRRNSMIF